MEALLNTPPSLEPLRRAEKTPQPKPPDVKPTPAPQESGDRRTSRFGSHPPEQESLPCPRCDSTHTKFCYYNNYNLSQPRHFCKSCRRYWTRGGTLRNVPVGGGSRKTCFSSHKRSRTTTPTSPSTAISTNTTPTVSVSHEPVHPNPVSMGLGSGSGALVNLNDSVFPPETESLTSWFHGQIAMGGGILPVNGNGPGAGLIYGLGLFDWPVEPVVGGDGVRDGAAVPGGSPGRDTWQINEAGMGDGECLSWPDLAISTLGKSL